MYTGNDNGYPERWDVLVIGAGNAGLCAAITAAEAVARLRESFPDAPIIARAGGGPLASEGRELEKSGAAVVHEATQMGLGLAEQVIGESLDRAAAESAVYKADARRPRAVSGPSRPFRLKLGLPAPPEASGGGWRPLGRSLRRRFARWRRGRTAAAARSASRTTTPGLETPSTSSSQRFTGRGAATAASRSSGMSQIAYAASASGSPARAPTSWPITPVTPAARHR